MSVVGRKVLRWRHLEGEGLEHLVVVRHAGGIRFESTVIPGDGDYAAAYSIDCTADWRVLKVEAAIAAGGRSLVLEHDGLGRWRVAGRPAPALDGVLDPDLSVTPLTNSFPIRRLGLREGESADIRTAYVGFPDLTVFADPQRYTCLERNRRYRYESLDSDFRRDIEVDRDGFVVDYPGLFGRSPVAGG